MRSTQIHAIALSSVALVLEAPAWAESHQPSRALVLPTGEVAWGEKETRRLVVQLLAKNAPHLTHLFERIAALRLIQINLIVVSVHTRHVDCRPPNI